MISLIKIIGFAFAIIMAYSTFLSYKKKDFNRAQFLFWEIVWVALILVVYFSNLMTEAVQAIGFIRVMDFLTVGGFVIITLLSFYNYSSINKIKKSLEKDVREEALKDLNRK